MSQLLSSGRRKYTEVLDNLINKAYCQLECAVGDVITIMNGVKKEKVRWVKREKWPKDKALRIETEYMDKKAKVTFRMITDTSINNL